MPRFASLARRSALIEADAALHGGFDTRGQGLVSQSNTEGVVVTTNALGQAGVLVTETRNICVDVLAENLGTKASVQNPGVRRQVYINPFAGTTLASCGDGTGTGGTTTPPSVPTVTPPATIPTGTTTVIDRSGSCRGHREPWWQPDPGD